MANEKISIGAILDEIEARIKKRKDKNEKDFDTSVQAVHELCGKLVMDGINTNFVIAGLIISVVELAYITADARRGPARDRLSELIDKAFNDVEREAIKSGMADAIKKAAELHEKGDTAGAMRVAQEFDRAQKGAADVRSDH